MLTEKQQSWIAVVTDPSDQRPLAKKLTELGLKMSEVRSWNSNPLYAKSLYDRTNKAFGDNRYAVLRSLQLEAMAGNVTAIKLYLELTGDYETANAKPAPAVSITTNNNTNNYTDSEARKLLSAILEILQRHLQPELLHVIVDELEAAVTAATGPITNGSTLTPVALASAPTPPPVPRPHRTIKDTVREIADFPDWTSEPEPEPEAKPNPVTPLEITPPVGSP